MADKSLTCKYATVSIELESVFSELWHFSTLISKDPKYFFSPIASFIVEVFAVILSKAFKFT